VKTLISLLGAYLVKEGDQWRSNDLNVRQSASDTIITSFRVNAAASLLKIDQEAVIYLQGGLADQSHPSLAVVMQLELLALGISKERMLLEEKSERTFQQLYELQTFVLENHPSHIKILSNEWHLPRVQAMVNLVSVFAALRAFSLQYVAAEEVLIDEDPETWRSVIATARLLPAVQKAITQEKRGIEQIHDGTYKFG
jgi:hypothetical protein